MTWMTTVTLVTNSSNQCINICFAPILTSVPFCFQFRLLCCHGRVYRRFWTRWEGQQLISTNHTQLWRSPWLMASAAELAKTLHVCLLPSIVRLQWLIVSGRCCLLLDAVMRTVSVCLGHDPSGTRLQEPPPPIDGFPVLRFDWL